MTCATASGIGLCASQCAQMSCREIVTGFGSRVSYDSKDPCLLCGGCPNTLSYKCHSNKNDFLCCDPLCTLYKCGFLATANATGLISLHSKRPWLGSGNGGVCTACAGCHIGTHGSRHLISRRVGYNKVRSFLYVTDWGDDEVCDESRAQGNSMKPWCKSP